MLATRVRTLPPPTPRIDHVLWSLDTPVPYTKSTFQPDTQTYKETKEVAHYVITSASTQDVFETYIFPANEEGKILDFMELPGSEQRILDHDHVIASFCAHYST